MTKAKRKSKGSKSAKKKNVKRGKTKTKKRAKKTKASSKKTSALKKIAAKIPSVKDLRRMLDITKPMPPKVPLAPQLASFEQQDSIASEILTRVRESIGPLKVNLKNMSHLHATHKSAKKSGGGHYVLELVAESFAGLGLKERHAWVMGLVNDLFGKGLHALELVLKEPSEVPLKEKILGEIRPVVKQSLKRRPT
jgi:BolA protein